MVKELKQKGIEVEEVYLFGSYARGDFVRWSDVDLVIISEDFSGVEFLDRLSMIYRVISFDASVVPVTREELNRKVKESTVLKDASRYWIKVFP